MIQYQDWRKANRTRKYTHVVLFEQIPSDNPREAQDCHELARFTHPGDAYKYASDTVAMINSNPLNLYHNAWAIVIR